jgi:hypothetical protein
MGRATRFVFRFLLVFAVLPCAIGAAMGYAKGWPANWRVASWASSGVLPKTIDTPQATVIILASRTGKWKSIFAEHMSILLKPEGAAEWTRYDVVGWNDPVVKDAFVPDAFWYGNTPRIIYRLQGEEAANLIPAIKSSIKAYPHRQRGSYAVWPGPNSNTFVAWVVRHTEGFNAELSSVAVGKDWLGYIGTDTAPSHTGYTVSIAGLLGATVAWEEGFELHVLGSTIGIDVNDLAIKLPALGKLSILGS